MGYLMTDPKEKSNLEKYNSALESMRDKSDKLALCSEKAVKTSEKLVDDLDKLNLELERLEPIKNLPNLSQTCKTKLSEIYTAETTGRIKDVKSKYFEKGLLLEEDAITAYSLFTGDFHKKNKERKYNDYIQGELDLVTEDTVHDTKVCWDIFTFDAKQFSKIDPVYEWQLDCYMWLWEKKFGKLIYCLLDTPEHLIAGEERKLLYDFVGSEEDYKDACADLRHNHQYSDLASERKIRIFNTSYKEERIEKIKTRVEECRKYLNNITNEMAWQS
jgi:hypothetical protein